MQEKGRLFQEKKGVEPTEIWNMEEQGSLYTVPAQQVSLKEQG